MIYVVTSFDEERLVIPSEPANKCQLESCCAASFKRKTLLTTLEAFDTVGFFYGGLNG